MTSNSSSSGTGPGGVGSSTGAGGGGGGGGGGEKILHKAKSGSQLGTPTTSAINNNGSGLMRGAAGGGLGEDGSLSAATSSTKQAAAATSANTRLRLRVNGLDQGTSSPKTTPVQTQAKSASDGASRKVFSSISSKWLSVGVLYQPVYSTQIQRPCINITYISTHL